MDTVSNDFRFTKTYTRNIFIFSWLYTNINLFPRYRQNIGINFTTCTAK